MKNKLSILIAFFLGSLITGGSVFALVSLSSSDILYDNSGTTLSSSNVQDVIDELFNLNESSSSSGDIYQTYYDNLTAQKISNVYGDIKINKDIDGNYYFDFDASNDYIQLDTLPETINWADGFTIEFKASFGNTTNYARIFDFGNGQSKYNILVSRYGTTNQVCFASRVTTNTDSLNSPVTNANIELNKNMTVKIVVYKEDGVYKTKSYIDGVYNKDTTTVMTDISNIERTINYIGKSNWSGDGLFKGRFYYLKIDQADGTNIVDVNVNKLMTGSKNSISKNVGTRDIDIMKPTDFRVFSNTSPAIWINIELGYIPRYIVFGCTTSMNALVSVVVLDTVNNDAIYYSNYDTNYGLSDISFFYKKIDDNTISLYSHWAAMEFNNSLIALMYK